VALLSVCVNVISWFAVTVVQAVLNWFGRLVHSAGLAAAVLGWFGRLAQENDVAGGALSWFGILVASVSEGTG